MPMVRGGPVAIALVLLASAAAVTWAHLAIASLTVCLNESPALADDLRAGVPALDAVARLLLPLFTPLGVATSSSAPNAVARGLLSMAPPYGVVAALLPAANAVASGLLSMPPPHGVLAALWPALDGAARWLLPLFTPLGVDATSQAWDGVARWLLLMAPLGANAASSPAMCDPAAQARAMAVAGLAYVAALIVLDRGRVSGRLAWPLVIGVATIVRLALFFMPALLSSDIIDYATHGRVASLHGANPYIQTPSQFPSDPLSSLGAWPTVVTVYGPLWTHVDAAITGLLPDASLVQLVFAYKLVGLAADVASVCLLFWLVRRWRGLGATAVTPLVAVAMWLWNPLVNVELIGNAHNES
ncbi:MAG: hypothetical protein JO020_04215, partial [Chloroflexi bacterium]|nr:hypothetical protein [Chloroflexota bacterium]